MVVMVVNWLCVCVYHMCVYVCMHVLHMFCYEMHLFVGIAKIG